MRVLSSLCVVAAIALIAVSGVAAGGCRAFADANWDCADVSCSQRVAAGSAQPNYECAEFVSRSLASGGHLPGLGPKDPQSAYGSYHFDGKTYDMLWTSSRSALQGPLGVEDFLIAKGWHKTSSIDDCTVVLVVGAEGYETHVAVGVAGDVINAHNMARYHVDGAFYQINNLYAPPGSDVAATANATVPDVTPYQPRYKPSC